MAAAALALILHLRGGEAAADDESAIEAVVVRAMTSEDPAICSEAFSEEWLREHFGSSTQTEEARCREATVEDPGRKADSVTVTAVSVNGEQASATAAVTGGNVGAATLQVELVDEQGWKLDRFADIDVDRDAYLSAQRQAVASRPVYADAEPLMACMLDFADAEVGARQIEASLLAGNEGFYAGAYRDCSEEFRRMLFSTTTIGAETSYSPSELRCISRTASDLIGDSELEGLFLAFVGDGPSPDVLSTKRQIAVNHCVG